MYMYTKKEMPVGELTSISSKIDAFASPLTTALDEIHSLIPTCTMYKKDYVSHVTFLNHLES